MTLTVLNVLIIQHIVWMCPRKGEMKESTNNVAFAAVTPVDRDSSVGIATSYVLVDPGIECRCGVTFSEPVQIGPAAHTVSCAMGTGSFFSRGWSGPGRGVDHPPLSSADVKERVELNSTPSLGPSWQVISLICDNNVTNQNVWFSEQTFKGFEVL